MIYISLKIVKYTVYLSILTVILGLVYCLYLKNNTLYECIYLSFCTFLDMPIRQSIFDKIKEIIIVQKFINNILLAIFAAFIFQDIITQKPPIVFPAKLLLRRRTSPGVEGKIAIALVLGNEYGYSKKLYDVTAKLTYIYNNGQVNANTQLYYTVQTVKNYNSFYFNIEDFPPHFIDCILSQSEKQQGQIDIVLHGKTEPYLHPFMQEARFSTSDIIIVKTIEPKVYRNKIFSYMYKILFFVKEKYCSHFNNLWIKERHIDFSNYTEYADDEKSKIIAELNLIRKNKLSI